MLEMPFERPQFQISSGREELSPAPLEGLMPTTHTASGSSYEMGSSKFFLG
jgi:hypothetical protein